MPQQTRDGHDPVPASPDDTTRLAGGPSAAPPPATGIHGQSARHGRPPVPAETDPGPAGEPDDTRPVSREWLKTSAPEQPAAATPTAATPTADEWTTQELSGYDEPPVPGEPEEPSLDDTPTLPVDHDGPQPPADDDFGDDGPGDGGPSDSGPCRPWWRR